MYSGPGNAYTWVKHAAGLTCISVRLLTSVLTSWTDKAPLLPATFPTWSCCLGMKPFQVRFQCYTTGFLTELSGWDFLDSKAETDTYTLRRFFSSQKLPMRRRDTVVL
ncbi:hypothetical protein DM02DRAFT_611334 [Periconia macrospinosa]|uniref:Uncharacterized protein n=1 Tax=Periconia macrospinosa TaxID=97972 RepID=A0A2V1E625_9PLEO|nr:hypothetical protein DM02DRAFT_611334 [Periconia macrospinosa]